MGSLADKLSYLNGTKSAIKNAIKDKGGTVAETDTFRSYAAAIASLPTDTSNITDPTVEHIVFPEECQVPEAHAIGNLKVLQFDDYCLMMKHGSGTTAANTAGTVTKIWRDRENESDEINFKVIARGDDPDLFTTPSARYMYLNSSLEVPGGVLLGYSSNSMGVYFFDPETDTLTRLISGKYCAFTKTTPIEDDPDGSFIIHGGNVTGLLKYNPVTREITDLTPGINVIYNWHTFTEYQGLQIWTGSENNNTSNTIPIIIIDNVEHTVEISDTRVWTSGAQEFSYYYNYKDSEALENVRFYIPRVTTTQAMTVDLRGSRTVSFCAINPTFFYADVNQVAEEEVAAGVLLYSNTSTNTTALGFVSYNKNTRAMERLFTAGYNFSTSLNVGIGILYVSNSAAAGVLFYDFTTLTVTNLYANRYGYDTFITQPNNTNKILIFHSVDSPLAGVATTISNLLCFDKTTKTITSLGGNNYFHKMNYSVRGTYGILFWNSTGTSTNYNGIFYYKFSDSTFSAPVSSGFGWGYYLLGTPGTTNGVVAFSSSGSQQAGVWFWADNTQTYVQSTVTAGYGFKFYATGFANQLITHCFFTSTTNATGCLGLYVLSISAATRTVTTFLTTGYNWSVILPISIGRGQGGCLISSANSTSLGLYFWSASYPTNTTTTYFVPLLTTGFNYNGWLQVARNWGVLYFSSYTTSPALNAVYRLSTADANVYTVTAAQLVRMINGIYGQPGAAASYKPLWLKPWLIYDVSGTATGAVLGSYSSSYKGLYHITSTTAADSAAVVDGTSGYYGYIKCLTLRNQSNQVFQIFSASVNGYAKSVRYFNGNFSILSGTTNLGADITTDQDYNLTGVLEFTNTTNNTKFYLTYFKYNAEDYSTHNSYIPYLNVISALDYSRRLFAVGSYHCNPEVVLQFKNAAIISTDNAVTGATIQQYYLIDYDNYAGDAADITLTALGYGSKTTYGADNWIVHQEKEDLTDPENIVIFAPQSHTYLYKWDAATRKVSYYSQRAPFNELEKLENENGDFLLLSNSTSNHTPVRWDNDDKTLLDPFGMDSSVSPNINNYINYTNVYAERDGWRYVFGYNKSGNFIQIAQNFIFKYNTTTLELAAVAAPSNILVTDKNKITVLPFLQNEILVCQYGGNYEVFRVNEDDTIEILEVPRFYDDEKMNQKFAPNAMIADFSEHNGFALIYSGQDMGGNPVYKYPALKRINTKKGLDSTTYVNYHMLSKNEYSVSNSTIYNHINELTTFSADILPPAQMFGTKRGSNKQFFMMIPLNVINRAYFFKTRAYSDVE